jgi:PAS domain S-box-containing protein
MLARTEGIAHIGSWEWDVATDTVSWSDELFRIFQRDPREGAPSFAEHPAFYHPDDMARLQQAVEAAVTDGTPYELELRAIRKDGATRVCVARGVADMKLGGRAVHLFGSLQDITERKRAEEALKESENQYRLLADNIHDVIFVFDMNLNYTYVSPSIKALRGYEPEEVVEKQTSFDALLTPSSRDLAISTMSEVLELEKSDHKDITMSRTLELELRRKDGTTVWAEVKLSFIRDENQQAVGILGVSRDITERKRADDELLRTNTLLDSIVEHIPNMIFLKDAKELRFLLFNRAGEDLLGYPREDMLGKNDYDFFPKDQADFFTEKDRAVIQGKEVADIPEEFLQTRNKGERTLHTMKVPILNAEGKPEYLLGISEDITVRKRVEAELKQSEERYRGIFDNAQEGIFRTTPNGKIIMANQALVKMLGYESPKEFMADITNIARQLYVNPEDRRILKETIEKHGFIKGYEVQTKRKDGGIIWISLNIYAVRDKKGQILHYEGMNEEITDRKQTIERMRKALGATVHAIAVTVETRDPYTAGHQRRVAELARAFATEMNLPIDQIDGIRMAAAIHDLGKISVPAEILSKPTKLTNLEFSLIKTHAQSGYDILKDIEFPWPIAKMVLEHHERMNGSGYPNGLTGDNILMESRILAVADVVESMASHRPYRSALGIDKALEEIEKNRGTLYDNAVADACLRLFREKGYQLQDASF